ncbi:dol-P-Glc:Glc(2)Man(9)GlcNAc(2)-PP-Dol alpha-1,2-glucosyltransferase [Ciona intestinalis]
MMLPFIHIRMLSKAGIFIAISAILFQFIYEAQPTAFIDEIFHVPQAQKFCDGHFNEWDPKITTLPGMYIMSVFVLGPLAWLTGKGLCSLWMLRFFNVIYNTCNVLLCYLILKKLREKGNPKEKSDSPKEEEKKNEEIEEDSIQWASLAIGFFPLLYFYSFLYYTEPGSTTVVLLAYWACINDYHRTAGVLGVVSILFRQTNIMWVVFMAGITVSEKLDDIDAVEKIQASPELKDKLARFFAKLLAAVVRYLLAVDHLLTIFQLIWPYLLVLCGFGGFVYLNQGLVVGDRSSHQAVLHLAQLLYFSGFTLVFSFPILVTKDKITRFWQMVQQRRNECLASALVCCYILLSYSHEHPYLLADNRHYVFYVWRWFLGRTFFRYLAVPVYMYSAWSINDSLSKKCTSLWKLVYFICVACLTAPQKLLEFRYFILPFVLFRLNVIQQTRTVILLELLIYAVINTLTVGIFLQKTFTWSDIPEPQRIIW